MEFLDIETMEKLEDVMMETLKTSRYRHCFSVAETAMTLAFYWEVDERACFDAGLLHDLKHGLSDAELLAQAAQYGVPVSAGEREVPMLLHGPLAAAVLQQDWGLDNPVILNAIRFHTVADKSMDTVAKIVYLADMIEPHRPDFPALHELRVLCRVDLDLAMVRAMESTCEYLAQQGRTPHPDTQRILADFRAIVAAKDKERKHMNENRSAQEIMEQCKAVIEDKKGRDTVCIDLQGKTLIGDYFLICTAGNSRQAQSISDALEESMKAAGSPALRIEGYHEARWILVDLGCVIVHIFQEDERGYYDLEHLWS